MPDASIRLEWPDSVPLASFTDANFSTADEERGLPFIRPGDGSRNRT